jgi:outer membrane protein OmpA-like peptidoglycan-associated protein
MRNRYLLGAGIALAVAMSWANAQAQLFAAPAGPGAWYFGGEGGWTSLDGQDGRTRIGGVQIRQGSESGFNIGARAGYEWGPWRFEEEFRFQQNGQSGFSIGGFGLPVTGDRNAYAFMTNAIYDFNVGWVATPHIGAGIGAVGLKSGASLRSPVGPVPAGLTLVDNTTWEFGYQAIAGVRYNINPALAFDFDYRYLGTTDPTFRTRFGNSYTTSYSSHSLVASLSVRFGAPPPIAAPAPPAPPMVARKVFLVFFDWDRDTITPDGMHIIHSAADAFRSGAPVTIQVTGYADRSGSPGYNQRLSERRANNVANAMVHLGVPRQAMVVGGRGENDNRVPTADGVREPQNRRVEIVFP